MAREMKNMLIRSEASSILCVPGELFFGYVQASFFVTCNELWATVPEEVRKWLSTGRGTTDEMKEDDMVYECCCKVLAGSEVLVRWFLSQGCVPNASLLIEAAAQGQLEVLKMMMMCAVTCGAHVVEEMVCMTAANKGHLNVVKWLTNNKDGTEWKDWQTSICTAAAEGGQLDVLKWARLEEEEEEEGEGCKWDVLTSGCFCCC